MPIFKPSAEANQTIKFSIIVPARNEEKNIGRLLQSLQQQTYPRNFFEVIVIDDHSEDTTANIVKEFECVRLISLNSAAINSYKKKAIEKGVAIAENEWIVCTDADCIVPRNWLADYAAFISQNQPVFIAAPVILAPALRLPGQKNRSFVYIFQALDFMVLQGITGASVYKKVHSMCNGANLAYRKDIFYEVNGFKGVDDIASGDDMLLMHKIWKKYPKQVAYIKSQDVIVQTRAAAGWKDFFNQRIRWASKAKHYDDKRIFGVLVLVYLFNFSFFILLVSSLFNTVFLYALLFFWGAKTVIELPFIINLGRFFNKQNLLIYFFFFQPLHIAYTIISGFLGSFGKYEWKGRRVK